MTRVCIMIMLLLIILGSTLPTAMAAGRGLRSTTSTATADAPALAAGASNCPTFKPVLAFGAATTDTGNAIRSGATASLYAAAAKLPYGRTFFKQPTGRFSDGRLMVDHLLAALKLPLLPPQLAAIGHEGSSSENYATAGATALLGVESQGHSSGVTAANSLAAQREQFKADTAHLDLSNALVYIGDIGRTDYYNAWAASNSLAYASTFVKPVVAELSSLLEDLLSTSQVKHIVVQGQFPMGCLPFFLTPLGSYMPLDKHGCVRAVSGISNGHNRLLRQAIVAASKNHPDAEIAFFDTTAAYLHIIDNAAAYGFAHVKEPCFPKGFSPSSSNANNACSNPEKYVSWDGIHATDAMSAAMVELFLTNQRFASPFPNSITSATSSCSI